MKTILNLILFLDVWSLCQTYSFSEEVSLQTAIFPASYNRDMRPGENRSVPLQVNVTFYFKSIKEFDESVSKFAISGAIGATWVDHRLEWDPNTYGGDLNTIIVPQKKIWVPFLVNMLMYDAIAEIGHNDMNLRLDYNGLVTWIVPNLFESTCDADLSYYPFDSQTCKLRFYMPGFMPADISFKTPQQKMDMSEYSENALWQVTETKLFTTINNIQLQEVEMSVKMRRRPVYYISSLIMPVAFLSFLQLAVFWMPPECGERVGFATTVLLAVAVYLTLIQEKLPEGSEPSVSYLSYKLLGDFMVGVLMTVGVVIGLRFYNREDNKVIPNYLKKFHNVFIGQGLCQCRKKQKVTSEVNENIQVKQTQIVIKSKSDLSLADLTWRDIGIATDRFCLMMFGFVLLNCNVVYIIVVASFY